MLTIQLLLVGLAWYLYDHDHTVSGRIFVAAILLSGVVNVARMVALLANARRGRRPRRP